jgi:carbon-monoxide dehydrogenase large subunit
VRFVGEALALVVATSAAAAADAADLIEVEYEDLPAFVDPEASIAPGATLLHDHIPDNQPFEYETGDAAAVEAAFAAAAHVTRLRVESTRVIASPMEPRGCLVAWDSTKDHYTVHVCSQGTPIMRWQLSKYTSIPENDITVLTRDVGGGFGQRSMAYPEYVALMLAARVTRQPVKWTSTRSEAFAADGHGRGNTIYGELALDGEGRFTALRFDWITDQGAYLTRTGPVGHIRNPVTCLSGLYRIPALYGRFRVALTNTSPITAYRGAGRPDVAYAIERLVNQAAIDTGIDGVELRRRNHLQPDAFPYKLPTGTLYENADMPALMEKALKLADWDGFEARRAEAKARGMLRGIGLSTVVEGTSGGNVPKDDIELECGADGRVTVYSVSQSQGQGHESTFARIVADTLGIAPERITLRQGDHGRPLVGNQTGGSRTTVGAASVSQLAAQKLVDAGKAAAAATLGGEPSQVSYAGGVFTSSATGRSITLEKLAALSPLAVTAEASYGATYPNGCHVAEVEVDPETGKATIASYHAVDDCGVVISHAIVEGQIHGAVAQGAGQVFGEHIIYDRDSGQLMTGSFSDYVMPRAGWLPAMVLDEHPVRSNVSPLGVKGVGESGCTASLGALTNAMMDAMKPLGVPHMDMPFTPSRVWHAIHSQ